MKIAKLKQYIQGFTVVELLVIIAVIGILASIAMVAYPGYQRQTRDNERKSDLAQVAAALSAYAVQKNNFVSTGSGCGLNGNGNGWLNFADPSGGTYPKSIMTCLQEAGVVGPEEIIDPAGCRRAGGSCGTGGASPVTAYMKATCEKGGSTTTYILAHLETQPRKDTEVDKLCEGGTISGFLSDAGKWGSLYGMNYYVSVR